MTGGNQSEGGGDSGDPATNGGAAGAATTGGDNGTAPLKSTPYPIGISIEPTSMQDIQVLQVRIVIPWVYFRIFRGFM